MESPGGGRHVVCSRFFEITALVEAILFADDYVVATWGGMGDFRTMMTMARRLVAFCVAIAAVCAAAPASANSKYAAFVMHADSGDVLFDRYSTARRYPASLTKVMTLHLLFDEIEAGRLSLDSKLKVSTRAAGQPPSKLGVRAGSTIDVETAIHALVVKSANDVAVVVAEAVAGSEWRFAQRMTAKARALGMRRTTFRNASGLPNSKQRTTARDMAILAQRTMQDHPEHFHFFEAKSFRWNERTYRTHNALVKDYPGATGLKTGYTRMSGYNLTTTADRDGHKLIGVVLGGRSSYTRNRHMREILDEGYAKIRNKPTLIARLHRDKPSPRLKPARAVLMANAAPTLSGNADLQSEIASAAQAIAAAPGQAPNDPIVALIAAADSDDFNEFERVRLAALGSRDQWGEGDAEDLTAQVWSVQIGAYRSKSLAQKELEAATIAARLEKHLRIVTPIRNAADETLYRARFASLTEAEAGDACDKIRSAKMSCFLLRNAEPFVRAAP